MIRRITMRNIPPVEAHSPKIVGRIEKVIIKYANNSAAEAVTTIRTPDGEILIENIGSEDAIFYPRNINVKNQKYTDSIATRDGMAETYAWIEQQYYDRKSGKNVVSDEYKA